MTFGTPLAAGQPSSDARSASASASHLPLHLRRMPPSIGSRARRHHDRGFEPWLCLRSARASLRFAPRPTPPRAPSVRCRVANQTHPTSPPKSAAAPCALPPVRRCHRHVDPAPSPRSAAATPCAPLLSSIGAATIDVRHPHIPVHGPQVPRESRAHRPDLTDDVYHPLLRSCNEGSKIYLAFECESAMEWMYDGELSISDKVKEQAVLRTLSIVRSLQLLWLGQLLGLDVGSVLEEEDVADADGANYQLEMMRCLSEVNVDNNTMK